MEKNDAKLLADGIRAMAVRLGLIQESTPLTGPQCLMLLSDIEGMVASQEPVAWANWKVGSKSYVPHRTEKDAQESVNQSSIVATQDGPYEVVALYASPLAAQEQPKSAGGAGAAQLAQEPLEAAKKLWNATGEQLEEADNTLRSISSYLGQGGCWEMENLDYAEMEARIREGIDSMVVVESNRAQLAAPVAQVERQACHLCGATKQPGICATLDTCPMNRA